ncbi:DUF3558 domain-containing protein [Kibdelosporangium philippinense]|uniref:DUF3558 domain-containing protein n=1 Tax=Kibdelosporangium philippinense TaxID=211113 RepID=A0ABS8ZA75_9PSEU|nr:DUF3558 family protein [Kibdelosporangium philippinense]MCE7003581.1 DUF3558 domain-containing protein [Kibdelosporangium philippinense]
MFRIGLGVAACLVVLGGCAQRGQGIIMATPPPPPSRLAPEVSLPLDIKQYADNPCSMLKQGQPVTKDLAAGVNEGGNTCTWRAKTPQQPQMTATIDLVSGGLEGLYGKRTRLPYFEPTDIQNYPAVRYDADRAVPDQGRCTVSVGVAEDALLTVTTTIADSRTLNYPVPCPDAELLANAIISDITRS